MADQSSCIWLFSLSWAGVDPFNYRHLNNPQPFSGQHNQNQPHPPASYGHPQPYSPPPGAASIYGQYQAPQSWSGTVTPPEVMRLFHVADRDRSGFLDEHELRQALLSLSSTFRLRTIRLLMFLHSDNLNNSNPPRMGFRQFGTLMTCLYQWQGYI